MIINLKDDSWIETGLIDENMHLNECDYIKLWELHPKEKHKVKLFGKIFETTQ